MMAKKRDMRRIMQDELMKFKSYRFHSFVYAREVDDARQRLKMSGIRFRTRPVYDERNSLVGYNIYTL